MWQQSGVPIRKRSQAARPLCGWDFKGFISPIYNPRMQTERSSSVQFLSVAQSCPTLWDTMDCSTPGFSVHRQFPELAQECLSSQWCHPAISSSVIPSSCLQSFPASGSFPVSQFFTSGGQSIGASVSASVLPVNIQDWFPLGLTDWISLQLSRIFSNTTVQKHQFFSAQLSLWSSSHIHTWLLGKTIALTRRTFVGKVMSLLFNMLSRLVITFLPRSKRLLISWLQSPSAVILEPKKIKSVTVSIVSASICHEVMGLDAMILVF